MTVRTKKQKSVAVSAEVIISDAMQRFPEAASEGDCFRQGDVLITRLEKMPKGCELIDKPSTQLAPGNTQGSRHCLSSLDGVKVCRLKMPNAYDGPVLQVAQEVTVTHPEHGDVVLPCGTYAISYQRTEDSEGKQRRVQD